MTHSCISLHFFALNSIKALSCKPLSSREANTCNLKGDQIVHQSLGYQLQPMFWPCSDCILVSIPFGAGGVLQSGDSGASLAIGGTADGEPPREESWRASQKRSRQHRHDRDDRQRLHTTGNELGSLDTQLGHGWATDVPTTRAKPPRWTARRCIRWCIARRKSSRQYAGTSWCGIPSWTRDSCIRYGRSKFGQQHLHACQRRKA